MEIGDDNTIIIKFTLIVADLAEYLSWGKHVVKIEENISWQHECTSEKKLYLAGETPRIYYVK